MDQNLRSALLYPSVLLFIMLGVIVILLARVLPLFNEVCSELGGQLTGVAGGLLVFGQALDRAMPVLLPSYSFRERIISFWRARRGDKGISKKMNTAHFAHSLAMGLQSGLPLEEALSLSATLLDAVPSAKQRCTDCLARLEQGAPLAQAMAASGVLPRTDCRLLEVGLRSGVGDTTMGKIARHLSEESESALAEKVGRVEPSLVVVTSIIVGLILLSVMLPLMHIMAAIG